MTYCHGVDPNSNDYIENANSVQDDMEFERRFILPPNEDRIIFNPPDGKGRLDMDLRSSNCLKPGEFKACFELIEQYRSIFHTFGNYGWDEKHVKKDMKAANLRYLLVRPYTPSSTKRPIAFMSFVLTRDDNEKPVLEITYLGMADGHCSRGVGRWIVGIVETIAKRARVEKVISPCFASNSGIPQFFRKLGYQDDYPLSVDDSSSKQKSPRLVILSKKPFEVRTKTEPLQAKSLS